MAVVRGIRFAVAASEAVRDNISTRSIPFPMEEPTPTEEVRVNASAGHLSVHVEGAHPVEVPFLFEQQPRRLGFSIVASAAFDIAFAALLVFLSRLPVTPVTSAAVLPDSANSNIIWLQQPGPGGGGGGGGNRMKEPPRKVELPGKDKITVPVAKPPKIEMQQVTKNEPPPVAPVNIPAKSLSAAQDTLGGAIEAPPGPPTLSQGSGTGGGAGTGSGTGIGPGTGSGLGPGSGGGTGGGIYQPGNGVSFPIKLKEVRPQYTSDAMRAKVQGTVLLQCVVKSDGTVGDVQVIRSLDPTFGLDQEAVKAAKQWLFRPGMRMGEPVSVLVTIELTFTLR
jgi:periplasmic protein TonB